MIWNSVWCVLSATEAFAIPPRPLPWPQVETVVLADTYLINN